MGGKGLEGYKQTEVGAIPLDWGVVQVQDICHFVTKGSTPTTYGFDWQDNGILFLRSECVSPSGLFLEPAKYISAEAHHMMERSQIISGDILMTITGNVGRCVVFDFDDGIANINQHIARIRIASQEVERQFVFQFLNRDESRFRYNSITTGQAYPQISLKQVRETPIPLPPLPEQQKIAEILTSVDETIESTRKVIAQTKKVKQGLLQELLTKGIGHTKFKDTEIGRIPAEWEVGTVIDFFMLQRGFDITKKQITPGDVPVFSSSGLSYYHCEAKVNAPGVVTGRKGKLGDVFYITEPYWPHDTTLWVKDFKGNSPEFIAWYLKGMELEQYDAATAVPTLNRNVVHRRGAAFPPLSEQIKITSILTSIDTKITAQEKELEALQQMKKGLMQDLLTGKVRVRV